MKWLRQFVPSFLTVMAILGVVASGTAVLLVKYKVAEKAEEVRSLAQQVHDRKASLRVLKAEWAYLTTPAALQDKSLRFLALMPPTPDQVVGSPLSIPYRKQGVAVEGAQGVLMSGGAVKKEAAIKKVDKAQKETGV